MNPSYLLYRLKNHFKKIKIKGRIVSRKSPDNVVIIEDGTVEVIENTVSTLDGVMFICRKYLRYEDFFVNLLPSHNIGIVKVSRTSSL